MGVFLIGVFDRAFPQFPLAWVFPQCPQETSLAEELAMDRQGKIVTGREKEFLRSFQEQDLKKDEAEAPRKVTFSEYMSSPEFQRRQKIASERVQQAAFQRQLAFRSAQEQHPIKGRPRRKRGRRRR